MSLPEYAAASVLLPADYIVFCEVSADPSQWLQEAMWVQSLADGMERSQKDVRMPRIGAIQAHPPPGFAVQPVANYSRQLDELQRRVPLLRGVRAYLSTAFAPNLELLIEGLVELGRRSLVVDTFVPEITDPRLYTVVRASPRTKFAIEHLGCGCDVEGILANATAFGEWRDAVHRIAALPNIATFQIGGTMASFGSISSVNASAIKPFVAEAIRAFGFNRLSFEANWFFSNWQDSLDGYGTWVSILVPMLEEMGATASDLRRLFRDNALDVYSINDGR